MVSAKWGNSTGSGRNSQVASKLRVLFAQGLAVISREEQDRQIGLSCFDGP